MPNRELGTLRISSWAVSTTDSTLGGWQFFEITRSKLVPYLSREPREGTCHIQGHTARQQQDTHHPRTLPTPMTSLRWLPSGLNNVVLPAIVYLPKSSESSKIHSRSSACPAGSNSLGPKLMPLPSTGQHQPLPPEGPGRMTMVHRAGPCRSHSVSVPSRRHRAGLRKPWGPKDRKEH